MRLFLMGVMLLMAACGADATKGDTSAAPDASDASEVEADAMSDATEPSDVESDTTPDTSEPSEVDTLADTDPGETAPDSSADDTAPTDTMTDADSETDAIGSVIVATPGQRCALDERIGLITIEDQGGTLYLQGAVEDRPTPWYGPPELTSEACDFYRFNPRGACPPCSETELCGIDGTCSAMPQRRTDLSIKALSTIEETLGADATTGDVFGELRGIGPYTLNVSYGTTQISVAATAVPGALSDVAGTLEGGYDAPTKLAITWSTSELNSDVFTRIPINHHASGPTFTECKVSGAAGSLTVDGPMLTPLAVITGLEFQGLEHTRFAAAQTPAGCVEVRYLRREFVNLF